MRKLLSLILVGMLLLAAGVPTAFARGRNRGVCGNDKAVTCVPACTNSCQYADENKDGICDNCDNACPNCDTLEDADKDGVCDNCGTCGHFMDADSDGVCDHRQDCPKENTETKPLSRPHSGRHHGRGHRRHS